MNTGNGEQFTFDHLRISRKTTCNLSLTSTGKTLNVPEVSDAMLYMLFIVLHWDENLHKYCILDINGDDNITWIQGVLVFLFPSINFISSKEPEKLSKVGNQDSILLISNNLDTHERMRSFSGMNLALIKVNLNSLMTRMNYLPGTYFLPVFGVPGIVYLLYDKRDGGERKELYDIVNIMNTFHNETRTSKKYTMYGEYCSYDKAASLFIIDLYLRKYSYNPSKESSIKLLNLFLNVDHIPPFQESMTTFANGQYTIGDRFMK